MLMMADKIKATKKMLTVEMVRTLVGTGFFLFLIHKSFYKVMVILTTHIYTGGRSAVTAFKGEELLSLSLPPGFDKIIICTYL